MSDLPTFERIAFKDLLVERDAEIDRLRAELAKAQKAVEIALSERVNLRAAMNNEIYHLSAELAEARRALLAGNDTVLANKKLQDAVKRAEAERDAMRVALEDIIKWWEALPVGLHYAHTVNEWLRSDALKAALDKARAALNRSPPD